MNDQQFPPTDPNDDIDLTTTAEFAELAAVARKLSEEDRAVAAAPESIWDGIAAQLSGPSDAAIADPVESVDPVVDRSAVVVDFAEAKKNRRPFVFAGGAVAAVAAAIVAVLFVTATETDDTIVVASTTLADLDGVSELGTATLVERDGGFELDVDLLGAAPAAGDGVLEIWVIDPDVEGMHSLGTIDGDGTFELPDGIDPSGFPIVDVSVEPLDGDATHSGNSVIRGTLDI